MNIQNSFQRKSYVQLTLKMISFHLKSRVLHPLRWQRNTPELAISLRNRSPKKIFENRGHQFTVEKFEQVIVFGSDDAMRGKRNFLPED